MDRSEEAPLPFMCSKASYHYTYDIYELSFFFIRLILRRISLPRTRAKTLRYVPDLASESLVTSRLKLLRVKYNIPRKQCKMIAFLGSLRSVDFISGSHFSASCVLRNLFIILHIVACNLDLVALFYRCQALSECHPQTSIVSPRMNREVRFHAVSICTVLMP